MTVNELIEVLTETGDKKFRDMAEVKVDYDGYQVGVDAFNVKNELCSVVIYPDPL